MWLFQLKFTVLAKQKRENKSLKPSAIAALGVVELTDFSLERLSAC